MKIILFCGDSHEAWSPQSVATGVGGSEEAVINIAFELVSIGHEVTVYNRCEGMANHYTRLQDTAKGVRQLQGLPYTVEYKDYLDYEGEECDIFISWRTLTGFKVARNYKKAYYWLHDTTPESQVLQALALGASKIMVLSDYHRRLYPSVRNEEVFLTRNGINVADIGPIEIKRVSRRVFYGSSYDRGLKDLLEMWPEIKLSVPDATLHVAYGWNTMEKMLGADNKGYANTREHLEELMTQEGVTHLGRISHEQVAKEMAEADVWGYPTWWPEISCITAIKAQAYGAIPVVIPTAAVAETVQFGYKTDRGYFTDLQGNLIEPAEAMDQFKALLIGVLSQSEDDKQDLRREMMGLTRARYQWNQIAKEWVNEFEGSLDEK